MTTETLAADIVDRMPALIMDTANAQQVVANLIRNFVEENYTRNDVLEKRHKEAMSRILSMRQSLGLTK